MQTPHFQSSVSLPLQGNQCNPKSPKREFFPLTITNIARTDYITTYIKVYPNIEIYFQLDLLVTPFFKVTCAGFEDVLFLHQIHLVNDTQQMANSFTIMQMQ